MVYKKFYVALIIRLIIFGSLCFTLGLIGFNAAYLHSLILLSVLIIISISELGYFLNNTNRFITNYFNSLYESGTTINFEFPDKENSFQKLAESMEKVWHLMREARIRQEEEQQFLKNLIKHIGTGVLAFNEDGTVRLHNPMAMDILGLNNLKHWSQLKEINNQLLLKISQSKASENKYIKCVIDKEVKELMLYISVFKLRNEIIRLVSIQNINEEMNRKEVLAWQQLIQIMAHEIMSTISPITSLSKHLSHKLNPKGKVLKSSEINQNLINDMAEGLEIISSRGEGLNDFISKYRSIAYLPDPQFELIDLRALLESIINLAKAEFKDSSIIYEAEKVRKIKIDKNLTEQLLLNLIRNSVEASSKSNNKIIIKTYAYPKGICVQIYDEGCGISKDVLDKIFVPFFSTKEKGTGIGLSFARKAMHLHGGDVKVTSAEGKWTRVELYFPEVL